MIHIYREKLMEVHALQFDGTIESKDEICRMCGAGVYGYLATPENELSGMVIETHSGGRQYHVSVGDYVACDNSETIHVYKEGYFRMKFRRVEEEG